MIHIADAGEVKARFTADIEQFKRAVDELKQAVAGLGATGVGTASDAGCNDLSNLSNCAESAAASIGKLVAGAQTLGVIDKAFMPAAVAAAAMTGAIAAADAPMALLAQRAASLQSALGPIVTSMDAFSNAARNNLTAMDSWGSSMGKGLSIVTEMQNRMQAIAQAGGLSILPQQAESLAAGQALAAQIDPLNQLISGAQQAQVEMANLQQQIAAPPAAAAAAPPPIAAAAAPPPAAVVGTPGMRQIIDPATGMVVGEYAPGSLGFTQGGQLDAGTQRMMQSQIAQFASATNNATNAIEGETKALGAATSATQDAGSAMSDIFIKVPPPGGAGGGGGGIGYPSGVTPPGGGGGGLPPGAIYGLPSETPGSIFGARGFMGALESVMMPLFAVSMGAMIVGGISSAIGGQIQQYTTAEAARTGVSTIAAAYTHASQQLAAAQAVQVGNAADAYGAAALPGVRLSTYLAQQAPQGQDWLGTTLGSLSSLWAGLTAPIGGPIRGTPTAFQRGEWAAAAGTADLGTPPPPMTGMIPGTVGAFNAQGQWVPGTAPTYQVGTQIPGGPPVGTYPISMAPGPGQFGPFGENRWIRPQTDWFPGQTGAPPQWTMPPVSGSGCFVAGTKIAIPKQGSHLPAYTPIETLLPGDYVLSLTAERTLAAYPVRKTFNYLVDRVYRLTFSKGEKLTLTANHPLASLSGWKALDPELAHKDAPDIVISRLKSGDAIYFYPGHTPDQIRYLWHVEELPGEQVVYNIELGEPHTYFAEGFLVHNMAKMDPAAALSDIAANTAASAACCSGGAGGSASGGGGLLGAISSFFGGGGGGGSSMGHIQTQVTFDPPPIGHVQTQANFIAPPIGNVQTQANFQAPPVGNVQTQANFQAPPVGNVQTQANFQAPPIGNVQTQANFQAPPIGNVQTQAQFQAPPVGNVKTEANFLAPPMGSVKTEAVFLAPPVGSVKTEANFLAPPPKAVPVDVYPVPPAFHIALPVNIDVQKLIQGGFQHGASPFGGGTALVGEAGPEVVELPRGTNIYPSGHRPSERGDWGTGGDIHLSIPVNLDGMQMALALAPNLISLIRAQSGHRSS